MWMLAGLVIACVLILWIIIDIGMPMSYLTIPEPLQITITFFVQHLPQILFIVLLIFSILIVITLNHLYVTLINSKFSFFFFLTIFFINHNTRE
jgi:hypothetical protein